MIINKSEVIKIKTFVIADLKLFDDEQRDTMGFDSFSEMNRSIVYSWNRTVSPDDAVIIIGKVGSGNFDEMKEVISHLNGDLICTSGELNDKFDKKQWREIGFRHFWNVPMFKELEDGGEILYVNKKIDDIKKYSDYKLLVVDEEEGLDEMISDKMISAEAIKWGYSPLDTEELMQTYQNIKDFMEMDFNETESVSEIKEEWEKNE